MSSKAAITLEEKEAKVWIEYHSHLHPCAIDAFQNCDVENSELCIPDMFLCGQYELDENSEGGASRGGSIHVCTINSESNSLSVTTTDCKSGVLDLKVAGDYVASAQSDSSLCIHQILKENEGGGTSCFADFSPLHLKEIVTITEEDEGLFLSVDWDLGYTIDKTNTSGPGDCRLVRRCSASEIGLINSNIAVSTQEGSLIVYELSNERQLSKTFKVSMAHQMFGQAMPAWIVCFDPHTKKTLVSGGDDCLMKLWDLRQGSVPTHTNKGHSAGVTSAQWHPQQENIFATGSYDEYLRIWDNRALRSPVAEIHAGKIHPSTLMMTTLIMMMLMLMMTLVIVTLIRMLMMLIMTLIKIMITILITITQSD